MDPSAVGIRPASGVVAPLVKKLFVKEGPGAGLVNGPVRISGPPAVPAAAEQGGATAIFRHLLLRSVVLRGSASERQARPRRPEARREPVSAPRATPPPRLT
ncbi:hypothetical protein [Streptomyces sp. NPDC048516]|uniref:hypothetical protein n=1 Tax=Streptomyces sp. NPDC048516 TaxID=3365565 RepID=UPI0037124D30